MVLVVLSAEGPLRPLLPQDVVLLGCQRFFPLFVRFHDGFGHDVVPLFDGIHPDRAGADPSAASAGTVKLSES